MSDVILPGSKEYHVFRKSRDGQEILGRYTIAERISDYSVPLPSVRGILLATGLTLAAITGISCPGSAEEAPESLDTIEDIRKAAKKEGLVMHPQAKDKGYKMEEDAPLETMEDAHKLAKKIGVAAPSEPEEKGLVEEYKRAEEKRKETAKAIARLVQKAEEMSKPTPSPVPAVPAEIPDAEEDLQRLLETPSGKTIRKVVKKKGTRILPRLSDLIDRGITANDLPYEVDQMQDANISLSFRGEVGEKQNSFAERFNLHVRPFNGLIKDVDILDTFLFNLFLENINTDTRRSYFEDLGSNKKKATIGLGCRINDLFDFKDAVFILGLDYTYEDTSFTERGNNPKQKYIGMPGINALLRVPSEDITAHFRARSGKGRWVSFPGRMTGNTYHLDYMKTEVYADIEKRFKGGWFAGADLSWQREDFEGVKEDLSRWALTLKGGKNNLLSTMGVKNKTLRNIDVMLAYAHTQWHHETRGTTDYDRVSLLATVPLYSHKGQELIILRPEIGYEFNGKDLYAGLELLFRFGR